MRLLLDTHALLWWLAGSPPLSDEARAAIADPEVDVTVSAASGWEIAIKRAAGKLKAPDDLADKLRVHRFTQLAITFEHARRAGSLEPHHSDPFDRMLVAQAQLEGLMIVTRDPRIARYGVAVLPA